MTTTLPVCHPGPSALQHLPHGRLLAGHAMHTANSRRARRQAFTCKASNKTHTVSPVTENMAGLCLKPLSTTLLLLQKMQHPVFFPQQANMIKEQAALDVMARMQRSTINAPSLTCPVDTAYLSPAGKIKQFKAQQFQWTGSKSLSLVHSHCLKPRLMQLSCNCKCLPSSVCFWHAASLPLSLLGPDQ